MLYKNFFCFLLVGIVFSIFSRAKEVTNDSDLNRLLLIQAEQRKVFENIHIDYIYKTKVGTEFDAYARDRNSADKIMGLPSADMDEHYSEKHPDWEELYQCSVDISHNHQLKAVIENLQYGREKTQYIKGKLNWVINEQDKFATLVADAQPNWTARIDNFLASFPNGMNSLSRSEKGKMPLQDLLDQPNVKEVLLSKQDHGIWKLKIRTRKNVTQFESYLVTTIDFDEHLDLSAVRYTYSTERIENGECKTTGKPGTIVTYSKHQKLSSGVYIPMEIHLEQFSALPIKIDKESLSATPWKEARLYKLKDYYYEIKSVNDRNPKDTKTFELSLPDLGTGYRVVDQVSGNVYQVGSPMEELKKEINKEKESN